MENIQNGIFFFLGGGGGGGGWTGSDEAKVQKVFSSYSVFPRLNFNLLLFVKLL